MSKQEVISRLLNNEEPKIISDTSGVKYATVLRYKRDLTLAQENGTVAELIDMDQAAFDTVIQTIQANKPDAMLADSLVTLADSKHAASALQEDLQRTASQINMRIRTLAMSAENVGELSMLTDALSVLQNAFFNKNATNVNVQNNYDSSNRAYTTFLGDAPGAN